MSHHSVELVTLAPDLVHCPESALPEVAVSGRSNVGKSSLINLLMKRRKLAYTSGNPGKTQALTYYIVDDGWHMVDMPGYGYAKVSQVERRRWAATARKYLHKREQLVAVLQLVDIRVGVTPDDKARMRDLMASGKPFCVVMTKADKIPKARRDRAVAEHLAPLGLPPETGVLVTSASERLGAEELWAWIEDHLPS